MTDSFESAVQPGVTEQEKQRLLHFVVVGGGPTGVEYAAELADMINSDIKRYYPKECTQQVRITLIEALDHILSFFDKSLSEYAEKQFARESIRVASNTFVKEVRQTEVVIQRKGQQPETMPCAIVVWATGIKPRPLIQQLREAVGTDIQSNRLGLLTTPYLQVIGTNGIYAVGDCATIDQPKLAPQIRQLFEEADINHDGKVELDEFRTFVQLNSTAFPQLALFATSVEQAFAENALDAGGRRVLTLVEFEQALKKADSKVRALPASAQVASQKALYLANLFNTYAAKQNPKILASGQNMEAHQPFRYEHLGSLAYIGGDNAVADFNGKQSVLSMLNLSPMSGMGTFYLWRSFYFSTMFTNRTRAMLTFDWARTKVYGRDVSRV